MALPRDETLGSGVIPRLSRGASTRSLEPKGRRPLSWEVAQ